MKKVFGKFTIAAVIAGILIVVLAGTIFAAGPFGRWDNSSGTINGLNCGMGTGLGAGPDEVVTKLLGMTQVQIQEQRQAGKSLVQIAASKNVSEEVLINTILADRKADLQKLVDAKTLTQDQSNQRLDFMKTQIKTMVERTAVGPPTNRGQVGGAGGMGRGMMGGGIGGGMMGRGWR
jgi:hypothetical protein